MRGSKGLFYFLLFLVAAVTLGQTAFPSQDGPLHLYYSDVLANLLRGTGAYAHDYEIKHWFPPYAFEPYALVALNAVLPALVAEKLLVALAIVWFAVAFRYLVHAVDPGNELIPLFAVPLATNRLLYMGFYSFEWGMATAIFAMGFWLRHYNDLTWRRMALFPLLMLLLTSMHPVPLLIALMFVAVHLAAVLWERYRDAAGEAAMRARAAISQSVRPIVCALLAACSLIWLAVFTTPGKLSGSPGHGSPRILQLIKLAPITPLNSRGYRLLLGAMVLCLVVAAGLRVARTWRTLRPGDWAVPAAAVICAIAFLVVPWEVNGGQHFPDRFPVFAMVLAAATAAGLPMSRSLARKLAAGVTVAVCVSIAWQAVAKQKVLDRLRLVYEAPVPPRHLKAAVVASIPIEDRDQTTLNCLPDYWAPAHYLRRARATFLNAAWLETPVMILKPRVENGCSYNDAFPMLQCLSARAGPGPDLLLAANGGGSDAPTSQLARAFGMVPLPFKSPLLRFYARPEAIRAAAPVRTPGPGPR